ncbi:MAG TPA: hypothetical protein VMS65_00430, partial [Polyangiaceae bacterium]|nr:hypothetical protein [Polyangiaceae bacterium]
MVAGPPEASAFGLKSAVVSNFASLSSQPSVWELRLLLALSRHVERQRWVASVVDRHLKASTAEIGRSGSFAHPPGGTDRRVPGLPGWSYYFHGIGCCLTHDDGTELDVNFDE